MADVKTILQPILNQSRATGGAAPTATPQQKTLPEEFSKNKKLGNAIPTFSNQDTGQTTGFIDPRTGNAFVGLSPKDAMNLIQTISEKTAQPGGTIPVSQTKQQADQLSQTSQQLQQNNAFAPTQQGRDLQPTDTGAQVPNIGILGKIPEIQQTQQAFRVNSLLNNLDPKTLETSGLENKANPVSEEYLLSLAQNQIDRQVLESGEAKASRLGVFIEGIPGIGGYAKYVPGITTPGKAVKEINSELAIVEGDLREQGRWADQGTLDPFVALENAQRYEKRVQVLESKLRFLIAQSPELRNEPEEVDAIQQRIQGIYNNAQIARTRAAKGAIENQVTSTDKTLLILQELKRRSENGK